MSVLLRMTLAVALGAAVGSAAVAAPREKPARAPVTAPRGSNPYANLLISFPNGGDGLAVAVKDALMANCGSAPAIVDLAAPANPDQKAAIALGLLRAMAASKRNNAACAASIQTALANLDSTTRAILAALQTQIYAEAGGGQSGTGGSFAGGGGFSSGLSPQVKLASPN